MDKDTVNKQAATLNWFLFLSFVLIITQAITRELNAWIGIIYGIIIIAITLRFGSKNLEISIKEMLFVKHKESVTILEGILLTLLLFSANMLLGYFYIFLYNLVVKDSASIAYTNVPMILYFTIIGPIMEEIVFRVVGVKMFEKAGGKTFSVVVTSFYFGMLHLGGGMPTAFVAGLTLALLAYLTGNVWYSCILHILVNSHRLVFYFLFPNLTEVQMYLILTIVLILIMILSLILLRKRPVFRQLLQWCNPKAIMENIRCNKVYYTRTIGSPAMVIIILFMCIQSFMFFMAQL